jgi:hypothetical protein
VNLRRRLVISPRSIAFEEIAADKIVKVARPDYSEMEAEADAVLGDAGADGSDSEPEASDTD